MSAGYSGTPLARKLGIKDGHRVGSVSAPEHFPTLLADLPTGVRIESDPATEAGAFDVLVLFARSLADLDAVAGAIELLDLDGGLWVAWPKKSSPLASDFSESDVRSAGLATGLVDNKICAIDADWSGLRFVYRKEDRTRIRQEARGSPHFVQGGRPGSRQPDSSARRCSAARGAGRRARVPDLSAGPGERPVPPPFTTNVSGP